MLWELVRAIGGFLLFMGAWFAVQALVRRRKAVRPDTDVLDHVKHGCGGCPQESSCGEEACGSEPLVKIQR
ncbi:MAG: hypothetical protein HY820_21370 [Acidobacteria bacterium]|nr:hypothetical protein [Acidobacteriota bacterium]